MEVLQLPHCLSLTCSLPFSLVVSSRVGTTTSDLAAVSFSPSEPSADTRFPQGRRQVGVFDVTSLLLHLMMWEMHPSLYFDEFSLCSN